MRNRDSNALAIADSSLADLPLRDIAEAMFDAVVEAEIEGVAEPRNDPAVMLLGAFVCFHTHIDIATADNYNQLVEACRRRASEPPPVLQ